MARNILILGASYGSLLATKLLMAGHNVTLVCRRRTANLINRDGTEVRIKLRDEATVRIDTLAEFEKFFTPKNDERPEIHGGLAYSHFVESPEMDEKLKDLKVTVRCVSLGVDEEMGKCIFTGRESKRRGVFAKAY